MDQLNAEFAYAMASPVTEGPSTPITTTSSPSEQESDPKAEVMAILSKQLKHEERIAMDVVLKRLPHKEDALAQALYDLDNSIFTLPLATQLKKSYGPDRLKGAKLDKVLALEGKCDGFEAADRLMIKLVTVPAFQVRIKLLCSRSEFPEMCNMAMAYMAPFSDAFNHLLTSDRLKQICGVYSLLLLL